MTSSSPPSPKPKGSAEKATNRPSVLSDGVPGQPPLKLTSLPSAPMETTLVEARHEGPPFKHVSRSATPHPTPPGHCANATRLPSALIAGRIDDADGAPTRSRTPTVAEVMGNRTRFDTSAWGAGATTTISARFAIARSAAEMLTLSVELLTKTVGRSLPLHRITVPGVNPAPVSVNQLSALPSGAADGETELSRRLDIVKSAALEVVAGALPLAGFSTG